MPLALPQGNLVDNTIRSAFVTCPQQANYGYIQDLHPVGESVHLVAGGAFAAGLEAMRRAFYEDRCTQEDALAAAQTAAAAAYGDFQPPAKSTKTREAVVEALAYYASVWPLAHDAYRPRLMEWRFRRVIPDLVHPDDGGPIYYVGRPDTLGDLGAVHVVEDDKTATTLGKGWANQWKLDSQFTGYRWAAQTPGPGGEPPLLNPDGNGAVLIRGVSFLAPKFDEVEDPMGSIVKTEGRGAAKVTKNYSLVYTREGSFGHAQVLVYRPQWQIDRWLRQLQRDVRRMIYAYLNNEWDYALHKNACAAYGGCPYTTLCESEHPEQWIPLNYVVRKWDPMAVV